MQDLTVDPLKGRFEALHHPRSRRAGAVQGVNRAVQPRTAAGPQAAKWAESKGTFYAKAAGRVPLPYFRGFPGFLPAVEPPEAKGQDFDLAFNHIGTKNQAVPSLASRPSAGPLSSPPLPSKYVQ